MGLRGVAVVHVNSVFVGDDDANGFAFVHLEGVHFGGLGAIMVRRCWREVSVEKGGSIPDVRGRCVIRVREKRWRCQCRSRKSGGDGQTNFHDEP